jgi:LacI family transcriptional regulator
MSRRPVRQVAVLIDGSKPYDRKVIGGISSYAQQRGRWSLYVEENPIQKLSILRAHRWDGVIANFDDRRIAAIVSSLRVPVVAVGGMHGWYDRRWGIPYIATDDDAVASLAFDHLSDRGFTQFAFCGFAHTKVNGWSAGRARRFKSLVQQAGLRCWVYNGRCATMRNWDQLQDELASWLASLPKPVGLMACNDARARHVLEACRRSSLRVPEDVALVGVDDDPVLCELTDPPLTSIDPGAHRVGEKAARVLADLMAGKRLRRTWFVVEPKGLVARKSSDIIAVKDPDVAAALAFVRTHACDGVHVDDVLKHVSIARATLHRRFHAVLGRSIHEEIQRVRLERARHLVADTDIPLKQVVAMTGFKQRTYFTVVFRQYFGRTAAEYRRRAKK